MWIFLILLTINFQLIITVPKVDDSIVNEIVLHEVELPTRLVENKYEITFTNVNDKPINHYKFYIEPNVLNYFIKASYNTKNLEVVTEKEPDGSYEKIILHEELPPKTSIKIDVLVIYPDFATPTAKTIRLNHPLYMQYKSSIMYYTCYHTKVQKKTIHVHNVHSYTEYDFLHASNEEISYGEYEDVEPFFYHPLFIGYSIFDALAQVNTLDRIIDASSLFGSITVTDNVEIQNAGPKFVGPFALKKNSNASVNALPSYVIFLPSSAKFINFYDNIGKISSFRCSEKYNYIKCNYKPRFPLYPGWKVKYSMRYVVPSYEYLYTDKNYNFLLKMRAIDHIIHKMVVKKATIKVILPPNTKVLELALPKSYRSKENGEMSSPISFSKRLVVNFEIDNAVEENIEDFELLYFCDTWWPNIFGLNACATIFCILISFAYLKKTNISI